VNARLLPTVLGACQQKLVSTMRWILTTTTEDIVKICMTMLDNWKVRKVFAQNKKATNPFIQTNFVKRQKLPLVVNVHLPRVVHGVLHLKNVLTTMTVKNVPVLPTMSARQMVPMVSVQVKRITTQVH
jgi:aspartate carbamoyltransferase regulatory subunit